MLVLILHVGLVDGVTGVRRSGSVSQCGEDWGGERDLTPDG